jgi:hypothetical protein
MQAFLKNLLNWRKTKEVIHAGKLTHFIPQDGIYVYFRYNEHEAVMVAINNNETDAKTLNASRYSEFLRNFNSGKEVISNQVLYNFSNITIQPKSSVIIELFR